MALPGVGAVKNARLTAKPTGSGSETQLFRQLTVGSFQAALAQSHTRSRTEQLRVASTRQIGSPSQFPTVRVRRTLHAKNGRRVTLLQNHGCNTRYQCVRCLTRHSMATIRPSAESSGRFRYRRGAERPPYLLYVRIHGKFLFKIYAFRGGRSTREMTCLEVGYAAGKLLNTLRVNHVSVQDADGALYQLWGVDSGPDLVIRRPDQ